MAQNQNLSDQSLNSQNEMQGRQGHSTRGFASMDPEERREIAAEGGRAAHAKGTAHEFDSEEARAAGRKGGAARSQNRNKQQLR